MNSKKDSITESLLQLIRQQGWQKGSRIPAERKLAQMLNVSRTTIRESVGNLTARGILSVKGGSGIFVVRLPFADNAKVTMSDIELIRDQLEIRYLLMPLIVGYAAKRGTEEEIVQLQKCVVSMSRAIINEKLAVLTDSEIEFFRILAMMTRMRKFIQIIENITVDNEILWKDLLNSNEFINNVVFAGYVEIVNLIKQKNIQQACEYARKNIIHLHDWFVKARNMRVFDAYNIDREMLINNQ